MVQLAPYQYRVSSPCFPFYPSPSLFYKGEVKQGKVSKQGKLDPYFITGVCFIFFDVISKKLLEKKLAESCFNISIIKNTKNLSGYRVDKSFSISLHKKDKVLLEMIQSHFEVGTIYNSTDKYIQYRVESLKGLKVVIDHFDKYSLITQKRADYKFFKSIVEMFNRKEHLTKQGLDKIVSIKASINKGLSNELKAAFPLVTPVQRPLVLDQEIPSPHWVSGFVLFFFDVISKKLLEKN